MARADVTAVIAAAALTLFTGRDQPPAVPVDWRRTLGVLDVELSQHLGGLTTVRIRVVPEQLEAVLLLALQNSWSIARVERPEAPAC